MTARAKSGDATAEFFGALAARGHEPLLEKANGTFSFELTGGKRVERWLLTCVAGDVTVSHRNGRGDLVVRADKTLFDGIVRGRVNATAAFLRGALSAEGDPELMAIFQRLFPGPPRRRRRKTQP